MELLAMKKRARGDVRFAPESACQWQREGGGRGREAGTASQHHTADTLSLTGQRSSPSTGGSPAAAARGSDVSCPARPAKVAYLCADQSRVGAVWGGPDLT